MVGEARDGREAVHLAAALHPDVVVLDHFMPTLNGLEAAREILRRHPAIAVVILTLSCEHHQIAAALRAGVRAYVAKAQAGEELVAAIQAAAGGAQYLSGIVARLARFKRKAVSLHDALSPRERQVLQLVVEGWRTKEIAGLLGVSPKTAESYRAAVMTKLDTHDTPGLVRYAVRRGIIQAAVAWGMVPEFPFAVATSVLMRPLA